MRGRRPEVLRIRSPDIAQLERIAHSDTLPWFRVRRARIVLGIAAGWRREVRGPCYPAGLRRIHHLASLSTVPTLGS
jgi:hypothetical protein